MIILEPAFYIFAVVVLIQVLFYGVFFGKFAFAKQKKENTKNIPVSVIICAKNEADNLKNFLPYIIDQDYPIFEIVLINDSSHDNSLEIMEAFAAKHDKIKIVNVRSNETFWGNKKYALTLGIKASKYDHLLFTDADCIPVSKQWITEMTRSFNNTKTIILGYGSYKKIKNSFLNKLIRFETLLTAVQYFSFAKSGIPFMGVGRNLAYKKDEFFKANGFINHMDVRSGDDDLFINQIATKYNTSLCFTKESFTSSLPKTTFKDWLTQKRRHVSTASHYKFKHKALLALFYISQVLFWALAIALLSILFNWKIVLSLILFRLLIQLLVFTYSAKKLDEKDIIILIPILEPFLIVAQFVIFISNLFSKPQHWK